MRHAFAAALIAATLLLSACSDDDDPPSTEPTRTPSGTLDTPSPTAEPTPTEPPLPDAATKATEAGARAFITYYWDLINYAQVTGDVESLEQASSTGCQGCQGGISSISELYAKGGRLTGGEFQARVAKLNELGENESVYAVEAKVIASSAPQTALHADGTREEVAAASTTFLVAAAWRSERWHLEAMEVQ